jgi:hypothetical protein
VVVVTGTVVVVVLPLGTVVEVGSVVVVTSDVGVMGFAAGFGLGRARRRVVGV